MEGIASTFGGEEKKEKDDTPRFSITADNLLPKIRRGLLKEEEKDDAVVVGWRADVKSRKDREEVLRYVKTRSDLQIHEWDFTDSPFPFLLQ